MKDVEVVDICVPTTQHVEVAIKAWQVGQACAVRKAAGAGPARCREDRRRRSIRQRDVHARDVHALLAAMDLAQSSGGARSEFGKVLAATFRRVASMPAGWYRDGKISGGAALDLHIHDTDFVQHLFGMPLGRGNSVGYSKTSGEIDHLSTQYLYDNIPLVHAEGGWCLADGYGFTMQYTVNFENATADFDLWRGEQPLKLNDRRQDRAGGLRPRLRLRRRAAYFPIAFARVKSQRL